MRTQNDNGLCLNVNQSQTVSAPSLKKSECIKPQPLISLEVKCIENLKSLGIEDLIHALKMIHDLALYHTDFCLDTTEKNALYSLKALWSELETLVKS